MSKAKKILGLEEAVVIKLKNDLGEGEYFSKELSKFIVMLEQVDKKEDYYDGVNYLEKQLNRVTSEFKDFKQAIIEYYNKR